MVLSIEVGIFMKKQTNPVIIETATYRLLSLSQSILDLRRISSSPPNFPGDHRSRLVVLHSL